MKLIFIGPQGSGKGTQAKKIARKLSICHISTGDLFRQTKGELKKEIDKYIKKGNLAPDKLTIKILQEKLNHPDCEKGFILDGFPRNLKQAQELDKITQIDKVILIYISDEESIKRISGRRICKSCNINYNIITEPKPTHETKCDLCGYVLIQREDDTQEAIKKRLEIYHKDTKHIIEHYKEKLIKINGEQSIDKVMEDILQKIQ